MSGVRVLHFLKDWLKCTQIYQYYTMALIHRSNLVCYRVSSPKYVSHKHRTKNYEMLLKFDQINQS